MEKSRSKNVNNSRVTHSVDPAVIEENAKKAPDGDALYREAFAKKLNELLEEKQIDQKTLAAKTKISETNISNNRNATTTIKLPALAKIARELGVSVDYLSGNSDIESINLDVQDICKKTGLSSKAVETLLYFKKKDILPDLTRLLNHITCDLDCILIGKDICRLIDDVKTALVYEENSPYALENFFKNEGTPVDGVNLRGYDLCIFRSQRIKDEISKWIDNVSGINNLESFVEKKRHDGFIEGIMNAQDNFKDRSSFTNIEHNTKK